ncbi:MAG: hypothetical protein AB7S44_04265 [Spirochaetales bacterium]
MLNLEEYKLSEEQIKKLELNEKTKVMVSDLFSDTAFGVLNRFCQRYSIKTLFELLHYNLNYLLNNVEKIGVIKKNNIIEKINDHLMSDDISALPKVDFYEALKLTQNSNIRDYKINQVFSENAYTLFRENCVNNDIKTIGELIEFGVDNVLYSIRGMGFKRIDSVKQKLNEICNFNAESNEQLLGNITLESKIEFVFNEHKYGVFRDFCKDNNILTLEDLKNENDLYIKLIDYPRISTLTIETILNGIKSLNIDVKLNQAVNIFKIHSDFEFVKTSSLFDEKNCTKVYLNFFKQFEYIYELNNYNISCLKNSGLLENQINVIYDRLKLLKYGILEFTEHTFDSYKQKDFYEPIKERVKGKTLEQIGAYLNFKTKTTVTRERVRQLERDGLAEYLKIIDVVAQVLIDKNKYQNYPILRLNVLENIFGSNENAQIVFYALMHSRKDGWYAFDWTYLSSIEQVVISSVAEKINKMLEKVKNTLPEMFLIEQGLKTIELMLDKNGFEYILKEDLICYFKNNGYQEHGKLLCERRPSKTNIVEFVIKNFYKNGFQDKLENGEYNLPDIKNIILKAKEYFNEDIEYGDFDRNVVTYVERSEKILRWENSKFMHIDNLNFSRDDFDTFIEILIEDIKNELENSKTISTKFIYNKHMDFMKEFNIPDYKCLHSLIRSQVADEFVVTSKYMLQRSSEEKINNTVILLNFIKENDGAVQASVAIEYLKWTHALFSFVVNNSKEMLFVENYKKIILLEKLKLTASFKNQFLDIIKKSFKDGYTNGRKIFEKAPQFFENNLIVDAVMVQQVARCLFQDNFVFKRTHILENKNTKEFTTRTIIQKLMLDEINKNNSEIIDYKKIYSLLIKDYNIASANAYLEINNNIPNVLFPVSNNELISLKRNEISNSTIEAVKKYLSNLIINNQSSVFVNKLNFNKLPAIIFINNKGKVFSFAFNVASFSALVSLYLTDNFNIISSGKGTREDRETFVVSKNSVFKSYEELIRARIKSPEEIKEEKQLKQNELKNKIVTITNKIAKEKQYKKQVELNMEKMQLEKELRQITG